MSNRLVDVASTLRLPVFVVVDVGAISLPRAHGVRARSLDVVELEVLVALATHPADPIDAARRVARELSIDEDALQAMLDDLRSRRLLSGPTTPGPTWTGPVDRPGVLLATQTAAQDVPKLGRGAAAPATIGWRLRTPFVLSLEATGFVARDHDGNPRATLTAVDVALAQHVASGARQPGDPSVADLLERLRPTGMVVHAASDAEARAAYGRTKRGLESVRDSMVRSRQATAVALAEQADAERRRRDETGVTRTRVVPAATQNLPLLSLGMIMSSAAAHDGGRLLESFELVPDWTNQTAPAMTADDAPGIFLFSNYLWSHRANLAQSRALKRANPRSLTIHGGPDTPKYHHDVEAYFAANDHIDIAIRGEGEATFAELLDALQGHDPDRPLDADVLGDVAGICFRTGDRVVRTAERERIEDLDAIPSPYLAGYFDSFGSGIVLAVVETNRGCPYGCTFCDWGSATLSRIRKFDLDRVFAELEWCAQRETTLIYLADANFGIFARDVEIAEKVVELKARYGFPKVFETNYAKNTVKHLRQIVETLSAGGITTEGLLSLQSMDEGTLTTIRRSNIKLDKYESLAGEFRRHHLPLQVDIMMGLPGSTLSSFRDDLQECVDRHVRARVFPTQLLVNSPMNDPEYRLENQIETAAPVSDTWDPRSDGRKAAYVVATSTYTRADYEAMRRLRVLFILSESFGVMRHIGRFVRQAKRIRELDFYAGVAEAAERHPERWPTFGFVVEALQDLMLPPASWRLFVDDLHRYVVDELAVPDDSSLATALAVQHALLPAADRTFPATLTIDHDFGAWHEAVLDAKHAGHHRDWPELVPPLAEFGPTTWTIEDPQDVCRFGFGTQLSFALDNDWELASPVARPMARRQGLVF